MFIDEEDVFTDMSRAGLAPKIRARNPLDPYRPPDDQAEPMVGIKQVSKPTETGLRHIGTYRSSVPTHRKSEETVNLMRDMNQTMGRELYELKKYLLDTTRRVAALEGGRGSDIAISRRKMQRSKTALGGERSVRGGRQSASREGGHGHRKPMKSNLWDPQLRRAQPVRTPSVAGYASQEPVTFPPGPLSKFA